MSVNVKFYEQADDSLLKFAVIAARSKGKWVYVKHKERDTFEIPGGHREKGETILQTANRELKEETGAKGYTIAPVCVYSVTGKTRVNSTAEETFGMLYVAEINSFEAELHSEIELVRLFDDIPSNLTYPLIQPLLIKELSRRNM